MKIGLFQALLLFVFGLFLSNCSLEQHSHNSFDQTNSTAATLKDKQRGVHVFGRIDTTDFQFLKQDHIDWVTLVPYGYQESIESPEVFHHRGDSAKIRRRNEHWLQQFKSVRKAGFKVFVKPHIWMRESPDGKWRSDIFPVNDENWEKWKATYRNFILRYAKLAEEAEAEMFCVGAELTRLTLEKPLYWQELIAEVKTIYSGKLTYAANWYQEFEAITFWDQLDYVGIQAYFPLVEHENPDLSEIVAGWEKHLSVLKKVHQQSGRPILFTELGYKSTPNSAMKPWVWMDHANKDKMEVSYQTQSNCYQAFFQVIWPQTWFTGVHLWQFRQDHEEHAEELIHDFTPQGKPAEEVIAKEFGKED